MNFTIGGCNTPRKQPKEKTGMKLFAKRSFAEKEHLHLANGVPSVVSVE